MCKVHGLLLIILYGRQGNRLVPPHCEFSGGTQRRAIIYPNDSFL